MEFLSQHDLGLVGLSYFVSVLGAFVALHIAEYIPGRDGGIHFGWLALAALVFGGCAIWAMHFIGMLAYRTDFVVTYDIAITLGSLLLPVMLSAIGFLIAYRWRDSIPAWLGAGLLFGSGVAAMHYLGMAALRSEAHMHHDNLITGAAIGIAVVAATAALRIVVHWRGTLRLVSPLLMGLAVCGMHYTAMAGMEFMASPATSGAAVDYFSGAWSQNFVGFASGLAVFLTLLVGAALVVFRKAIEIEPDGILSGA